MSLFGSRSVHTAGRACAAVERRLASGRTPSSDSALRAHLDACESCRASAAAHAAFRGRLADYARAGAQERGLSPSRRALIAREAARSLESAGGRRPESFQAAGSLPGYSWAAVMAVVVLVLGAGYLLNPAFIQTSQEAPALVPPVHLRVSQEGDAVILEWEKGRQGPFIVRQAASAKQVREAPGVQVRGTRYVDRSPADSRMVYYLVE